MVATTTELTNSAALADAMKMSKAAPRTVDITNFPPRTIAKILSLQASLKQAFDSPGPVFEMPLARPERTEKKDTKDTTALLCSLFDELDSDYDLLISLGVREDADGQAETLASMEKTVRQMATVEASSIDGLRAKARALRVFFRQKTDDDPFAITLPPEWRDLAESLGVEAAAFL